MKKKKPAKRKSKFARDLVERGEAVVRAEGETLPPGATHEIAGEDAKGEPIVKRRRYSLK